MLRVVGPPGSGKTMLIVALTSALRARGVRVGSSERRADLAGGVATVVTLGSGARVTLAGALPLDALARRATALDPALDLLFAEGYDDAGVPAIEVLEESHSPPSTPGEELLAAVPRDRLAAAFAAHGPADDLGLAALIEERLLERGAGVSPLARAAEAPIETSRRLLDRSEGVVMAEDAPEASRGPRGPRGRSNWLRRVLGR